MATVIWQVALSLLIWILIRPYILPRILRWIQKPTDRELDLQRIYSELSTLVFHHASFHDDSGKVVDYNSEQVGSKWDKFWELQQRFNERMKRK